jgi:hypothetical protein
VLKEPCVFAKEPLLSAKEPSVSGTFFAQKKQRISSNKPLVCTKEAYVSRRIFVKEL